MIVDWNKLFSRQWRKIELQIEERRDDLAGSERFTVDVAQNCHLQRRLQHVKRSKIEGDFYLRNTLDDCGKKVILCD